MSLYLGIDPGSSSGAVCVLSNDLNNPYPPFEFGKGTLNDFHKYLLQMSSKELVYCVVEKVNIHPGTAVKSASSFMKNCGNIEMALVCHNIPYKLETPGKWMKHFGMKKDKNETKTEWKKRLRALAEARLPVKIKATTADAYLLALYCKETFNK